MTKYLFYLLFASAVFFSSCAGTKKLDRMTIASQQGDCVGVVPMKCLLVKVKNQDVWSFFYSNIEGFNYESGYEYVIEVRKEVIGNEVVDRSSVRYILVKEISKIQKISEKLPDGVK